MTTPRLKNAREADHQRECAGEQHREGVAGLPSDAQASPEEQRVQRNQAEDGEQAQLLGDDGADEVGPRLGQEVELGSEFPRP